MGQSGADKQGQCQDLRKQTLDCASSRPGLERHGGGPTQSAGEQFEEHLPQVHDGLLEISRHLGTPEEQDIIARVYQQIKSISIDYGVMEKAKNVLVVLSNFEWNDLGSWDEVYKLSPKDKEQNALCDGDHALVNTSGCLIDVAGKTVAAVGIRDLIVVETEDALLLCPREHAQDVKEVVELLKRKKKMNLL